VKSNFKYKIWGEMKEGFRMNGEIKIRHEIKEIIPQNTLLV
jgi:hypothetical protein